MPAIDPVRPPQPARDFERLAALQAAHPRLGEGQPILRMEPLSGFEARADLPTDACVAPPSLVDERDEAGRVGRPRDLWHGLDELSMVRLARADLRLHADSPG